MAALHGQFWPKARWVWFYREQIIVPYIYFIKDWRLIKELRPGLGMLIFLPLVAAWYVPVSLP